MVLTSFQEDGSQAERKGAENSRPAAYEKSLARGSFPCLPVPDHYAQGLAWFLAIQFSLERLAELDGDFMVYPGHGESTTLERERKVNPYMR